MRSLAKQRLGYIPTATPYPTVAHVQDGDRCVFVAPTTRLVPNAHPTRLEDLPIIIDSIEQLRHPLAIVPVIRENQTYECVSRDVMSRSQRTLDDFFSAKRSPKLTECKFPEFQENAKNIPEVSAMDMFSVLENSSSSSLESPTKENTVYPFETIFSQCERTRVYSPKTNEIDSDEERFHQVYSFLKV